MGCLGVKNQIQSRCMSVMLSPSKLLDEMQPIWCMSYSQEWGVQRQFFLPCSLGPWGQVKSQISFNFNYKVNFKEFIPNFVCVLTNERNKTYQTRFFLSPGLGVKNQIPSRCLFVMLSPPKPLDEIQPTLVCELLT